MKSCDKLIIIFQKEMIMMFRIMLNDVVYHTTSNPAIAWANYRALARDNANKSATVSLYQDDQLLHQKAENQLLVDKVDMITSNQILMLIKNKLGISIKEIKDAVQKTDLKISNSRLNGWFVAEDDRRYTEMHNDELLSILEVVLDKKTTETEIGFTAQNLKTMRKQLNMTQQDVAELVGVSGNRQVRRWENGEQDMPTEKWQIFLNYFKNNACNRT